MCLGDDFSNRIRLVFSSFFIVTVGMLSPIHVSLLIFRESESVGDMRIGTAFALGGSSVTTAGSSTKTTRATGTTTKTSTATEATGGSAVGRTTGTVVHIVLLKDFTAVFR